MNWSHSLLPLIQKGIAHMVTLAQMSAAAPIYQEYQSALAFKNAITSIPGTAQLSFLSISYIGPGGVTLTFNPPSALSVSDTAFFNSSIGNMVTQLLAELVTELTPI